MSGYTGCRTNAKIIRQVSMEERELFVKNVLCDEESKVNFEARKVFARHKGLLQFYKTIRQNNIKYKFRDIDHFLLDKNVAGWCVWGMDDIGLYHYELLCDSGFKVAGMVHKDKSAGTNIGIPVLSLDQCIEMVHKENYALLITLSRLEELPDILRLSNNILAVEHHLVGRCGWQYFDYFTPYGGEVFIDGGCLDGATCEDFITWCNGQFDKIYAFEPNPRVIDFCRESLQKYGENKVLLFDKALWKESTVLLFDNHSKDKWDACLSENGNIEVQCISIDEAIEEKVTFIKLDVEGSELEVLMGASESIRKNRPRMAISIYHKDFDFLDIPCFLLSLNPFYRFAIRHYHSDCIETILYAFSQEVTSCRQ